MSDVARPQQCQRCEELSLQEVRLISSRCRHGDFVNMPGGRTAENCCRIGTYQTNTPHHAVAQLVALLETGFPSTPQHHHRLHRPGRRPFQGRSWKKKMTTGRAQQAIRRRRHHPRSHCPALNSAQRAVPASSTPTASRLPRHPYDIERRRVDGPPPPLPDLASQQVGVPRRTVASSPLLAPMATTERPKKPSRKVALALGYGPLDWAGL